MEKNIVGIVFSKDRAMQLDATLRSFFLNCRDANRISLIVIYKTSTIGHESLYKSLRSEYRSIHFIKETIFKKNLLTCIRPFDYFLFLVDDNVFVREFSLKDALTTIVANPDSIGFSLRLGKNTIYCYPSDSFQKMPLFEEKGNGILKYDWVRYKHDFGYPLEVSSSIYRVHDLFPQLIKLQFLNPSTLEVQLDQSKSYYQFTNPSLLCYEHSVAFCAPINLTQTIYPNRVGHHQHYDINSLAEMFKEGKRIDINRFVGFVPDACHQEVELSFKQIQTEVSKLSFTERLSWIWWQTGLSIRTKVRRISKAIKCLTIQDAKLPLRARMGDTLEALGLERELTWFRRHVLRNQKKSLK